MLILLLMLVIFEVKSALFFCKSILFYTCVLVKQLQHIYTYYKTLTQEESLQQRGKADERNQIRRRRERLNRVCQAFLIM